MLFYSTNSRNTKVSLQQAVTQGLAPDNGLYMPDHIPLLPREFFASLEQMSFQEIAFTIAQKFLGDDVAADEIRRIIEHTIQFDAPVVEVEKDVYALELFHGPTMAFKDFGARFMSRLLSYFSRQEEKEIVILVATSGDTGSAVANGFLGVDGTKVIVLYPSGKVSDVQEKQFTTLGRNVTALEVEGTFDDCQRLVKMAFLDDDLRRNLFLTSANSINIARLIPQSFYFVYAFGQVKHLNKPIVVSVPSGNFGNLTGGLIAKKMGLPIEHFVAATNVNDIVPEFLRTTVFSPRSSRQTIANAMDVGNPSNFVRMLDVYDNDFAKITSDISGFAFTDDETREAMRQVYRHSRYMLDPHGAIGYLGLKKYLDNHPGRVGIFLETAHPGKFVDVVESTLNKPVVLPEALRTFLKKEKLSVKMTNRFDDIKQFIMENY